MTVKRLLSTLTILLLPLTAGAQYLLLMGNEERTALYLNPAKVWNYNHYEHSRWGAGIRLVTHPTNFIFNRIDADAYFGYGTYDERWKYGVGLSEFFRNSVFYQRAVYDYTAAGSRRIPNPWSNEGQLLGNFMASRMTEVHSITLGYRLHTSHWRWAMEIEGGERGWLFDDKNLIYNNSTPINFTSFIHLRLLMRHQCGISAMLEGAIDGSMVRLLADYKKTIPLNLFKLDIYAQGGITPKHNEYIDMFDLGGMWGSPLYMSTYLSTARPNEFTANTFAMINLRLQTARPLYKIHSELLNVGSNPSPFVALTAVWGNLWGQDSDGRRAWLTSYLQAPNLDILEPTLGINGIIHFGEVDWGGSITYRTTPKNASYCYTNPQENLMFILTATLLLNEK